MKQISRILILEDDKTFRAFVRAVLDSPGRDIHEAATALDALHSAHLSPPDMILVDLGLGGGFNGFDFLEALHRDAAFAGLPVVVVSGCDDPDVRARATRLGVVSYLVKPVSPAALLELVEQLEGGA